MRILLLTQVFNGLAQRLYVELAGRGHTVSVEFDIHEDVTREAVDLFRPDLLIAPYLKRAIPGDVWRRLPCLVVHPGIRGDRGPSALDWAILGHESDWGVTLLQANAEMDAGHVWATASFPMRVAAKSSPEGFSIAAQVATKARGSVTCSTTSIASTTSKRSPSGASASAVVAR